MTQDTDSTTVVFRFWKDHHKGGYGDGVLALFPEVSHHGAYCDSYEHVGQHGGADYDLCIAATRPATPAEYAALKAELEGRGYTLTVRQRRPTGRMT